MPQPRDIRTLDIHGLEETMEKYPWFAVARAEYFAKMAALDREYIRPAARKVGLYVPDRCRLYDIVVLGHTPQAVPTQAPAVTPAPTPLLANVRPDEDHRDDSNEVPEAQPEIQPAEQPEQKPAIVIDPACPKHELRQGGKLCDLCPTMLKLMGMPQPKEMTGVSLF